MTYSDESYNLRIELDTKNCECSAEEIRQMEEALRPLDRLTQAFPVSDLYVTIYYHNRSRDYHVKTSLVLSGRTLFTGERHEEMYPAYKQCIDQLVRKVTAYKYKLSDTPERSKHAKHTHQEILASQIPSINELLEKAQEGDYPGFRNATVMYEEEIRKRVGRWIQRYPEVNAEIGRRLVIDDFVEDVFLTAFDRFEHKPANVLLGDWFESLIDPVVHDILSHPDQEMENIEMARSMRDAQSSADNTRQSPPNPT